MLVKPSIQLSNGLEAVAHLGQEDLGQGPHGVTISLNHRRGSGGNGFLEFGIAQSHLLEPRVIRSPHPMTRTVRAQDAGQQSRIALVVVCAAIVIRSSNRDIRRAAIAQCVS
jgi:hypothetical protein